ncbi:MAG: hypothetical protein U1A78_18715 [Polyangia bacterium]
MLRPLLPPAENRPHRSGAGRSRLASACLRGLPALGLLAALGTGGLACDNKNKPVIIKGPSVQPVSDARWSTMRATHRVHIDAQKGDGREQINVRGLLAIERPDRFRLQALGPAGVQLFDIIKVGGEVRVVQGVPGVDSALQGNVLRSLGADLSAAYDLEPRHPARQKSVDLKVGELRIVETERTVRCQQFKEVQGMSIPAHLEIENTALNYKVSIDVETANLDEKLDPALFRLSK